MQRQFVGTTTYFLQEGRENLRETLAVAFEAARLHNIETIIIFTSKGEGVRLAIEKRVSEPGFSPIRLVAVTFPNGKRFTDKDGHFIQVEISPENRQFFAKHEVPIVSAHLPFDPIDPHFKSNGILAQDLCLLGEALNMFCGSMSLCVQAITLACDAGIIALGQHVISMTSDTAILAQATSTRRMLDQMVIREILCKPAILNIGRREASPQSLGGSVEETPRMIPSDAVGDTHRKPNTK